jgi:hypothetical protein
MPVGPRRLRRAARSGREQRPLGCPRVRNGSTRLPRAGPRRRRVRCGSTPPPGAGPRRRRGLPDVGRWTLPVGRMRPRRRLSSARHSGPGRSLTMRPASTSPRRRRERLSAPVPLPAAMPSARWTLPLAGPVSVHRRFRRGTTRGTTWTRGGLGRRSGRRRFSLVGTCSATWARRCRLPGSGRRRSGILWRFPEPPSLFGGRCRDPRCGGDDLANGVTALTPVPGRGASGRRILRRHLGPVRGGDGSGWRPCC